MNMPKFVDSGNFKVHQILEDPIPATYGSVSKEQLEKNVKAYRDHQREIFRQSGLQPLSSKRDCAV